MPCGRLLAATPPAALWDTFGSPHARLTPRCCRLPAGHHPPLPDLSFVWTGDSDPSLRLWSCSNDARCGWPVCKDVGAPHPALPFTHHPGPAHLSPRSASHPTPPLSTHVPPSHFIWSMPRAVSPQSGSRSVHDWLLAAQGHGPGPWLASALTRGRETCSPFTATALLAVAAMAGGSPRVGLTPHPSPAADMLGPPITAPVQGKTAFIRRFLHGYVWTGHLTSAGRVRGCAGRPPQPCPALHQPAVPLTP